MLASPLIRNYLINYARPLIYSTAMTHLSVLAVQKSLEMLEEGEADPVESRPLLAMSCTLQVGCFR